MGKFNFIKTQDPAVAKELKKGGFALVSENNGMFVFVNNGTLNFDKKDRNVAYSNNLEYA